MIKLVVFGSRSVNNLELIYRKLDEYNDSSGPIGEVVSGGAKGPDSIGESWAKSKGIAVSRFIPEWHALGKFAGIQRNRNMADYADGGIGFWDGKSTGTANMIDELRQRRKPVEVVLIGVNNVQANVSLSEN